MCMSCRCCGRAGPIHPPHLETPPPQTQTPPPWPRTPFPNTPTTPTPDPLTRELGLYADKTYLLLLYWTKQRVFHTEQLSLGKISKNLDTDGRGYEASSLWLLTPLCPWMLPPPPSDLSPLMDVTPFCCVTPSDISPPLTYHSLLTFHPSNLSPPCPATSRVVTKARCTAKFLGTCGQISSLLTFPRYYSPGQRHVLTITTQPSEAKNCTQFCLSFWIYRLVVAMLNRLNIIRMSWKQNKLTTLDFLVEYKWK